MTIKVLSYNIHSCFGVDRKYAPERIRDVILEIDADVVALQEVDSSLEVTDGVDQLQFLADGTKMNAVMGPTLKRGYGAYGNAFLSKWPLLDVRESDLTYRRFEPRGLLQAAIAPKPGQQLDVINTHLGLKWWERQFQVTQILDSLRAPSKRDNPLILLGDFNEWLSFSGNLRRLKSVFSACASAKTFPSRWPRFQLDRIFVSPHPSEFRFSAISTSQTRVASDHLPLVATIEF